MIFKILFGTEIHVLKSDKYKQFKQLLKAIPTIFKTLPSKYIVTYVDEEGDEIIVEDENDYEVLITSSQKTAKINIKQSFENHNEVHIDKFQKQIIEGEVSEIRKFHCEQACDYTQIQQPISFQEEKSVSNDHIIEEKIKKMLPGLIEQIKGELRQESMVKEKDKVEVVHEQIICDGCEQDGIIGIRYKCSVCPNFDLCERCEATAQHPHPFLKIKTLKQTPLKIFTVIKGQEQASKKEEVSKKEEKVMEGQSFEGLLKNGVEVVKGFLRGDSNQKIKEKCEVIKQGWKKKTEEWSQMYNSQMQKQSSSPKVEQKVQRKPCAQKIQENANYLESMLGFGKQKAFKLSEMCPDVTKEQLLNYCLYQPDLFE